MDKKNKHEGQRIMANLKYDNFLLTQKLVILCKIGCECHFMLSFNLIYNCESKKKKKLLNLHYNKCTLNIY